MNRLQKMTEIDANTKRSRKGWWSKSSTVGALVTLGQAIYDGYGQDHYLIGIGQSSFYPMHAANQIAARHSQLLAHISLPMSDNIIMLRNPDDTSNRFNVCETDRPQVLKMAEKIGTHCQRAIAENKTPTFFDILQSGSGFASIMGILDLYDEIHRTDMLNRAELLCFRDSTAYQHNKIIVSRRSNNGRITFTKNIAAITVPDDLGSHLGITGIMNDDERAVPELPLAEWDQDKEPLPETPTVAAIKRAISRAVAAQPVPAA